MFRIRSRGVIGFAVVAVAGASALGIARALGGSEVPYATVQDGDYADLAANVSAINHAHLAADALSAAAEHTLAALPVEMKAKLAPDAAERTRKVFEAATVGGVFVAPTNEGFALITNEGVSFIPGVLGDANPIAGSAIRRRPEDPVTVFGIATDDVARIDIVAGGTKSRATLNGNGYYWIAATPVSLDDVHLLVTLKNGHVVRS